MNKKNRKFHFDIQAKVTGSVLPPMNERETTSSNTLLTATELWESFRLDSRTACALVRYADLPAVTMQDGSYRFHRTEIEEWMKKAGFNDSSRVFFEKVVEITRVCGHSDNIILHVWDFDSPGRAKKTINFHSRERCQPCAVLWREQQETEQAEERGRKRAEAAERRRKLLETDSLERACHEAKQMVLAGEPSLIPSSLRREIPGSE